MHHNPFPSEIASALRFIKTIAVIGCSDKADRPSNIVAAYLAGHGYTIIPVNPNITEALGVTAYPSLSAIPASMHIDCVDVFRKPQEAEALAHEAIDRGGVSVFWMQEGVVNDTAATLAEAAGMTVVMNRCMMKEHAKLENQGNPA